MAIPVVPVAVKVKGEPVSPLLVADKVFNPEVAPKIQLPTVAIPLALVVADKPDAEPSPVATAKVTLMPLTTLLYTSFTITLGKTVTAVPDVADWLSPELMSTVWRPLSPNPNPWKLAGPVLPFLQRMRLFAKPCADL